MYKAIMVGYAYNHTRNAYKLYNPDTKRVIMKGGIKWKEWKTTDPAETTKMSCDSNKDDILLGI